MYIYTYIYIYREREICIYIYIYIYRYAKIFRKLGAKVWLVVRGGAMDFGGNHLSDTTCLTQLFFRKWQIMKQMMLLLDATKHA